MRTEEEVKVKVNELYKFSEWEEPDLISWDGKTLSVSRMYAYVPFNFEIARQLMEFVGAKNITSDSFSEPGCETGDYGSQYTVEMTFEFEDKK